MLSLRAEFGQEGTYVSCVDLTQHYGQSESSSIPAAVPKQELNRRQGQRVAQFALNLTVANKDLLPIGLAFLCSVNCRGWEKW